MDYIKAISDTEAKYDLKPGVLKKLIEVESGGNLNAKSPKGALGLTQLMPETAKEMGVDPNDPLQNIEGGARYLKQGLDKFNGNYAQAIAGYNAGHNNKAVEAMDYNALPSETKKYANQFAKVNLIKIDDVFGGWQKAQKTHFNDGGVFDEIILKK